MQTRRLFKSSRTLILSSVTLLFILLFPAPPLSTLAASQNGSTVITTPASGVQLNFTQGAYTMTQIHLPAASSGPWYISTDQRTGLIWFVEQGSNQIGSINPSTLEISEYSITTPNSSPEAIAPDSSGRIWITELGSNQIGELNPAGGAMSEFRIPRGPDNLACGPDGITVAETGTIWFTCEFSNQIDEFFPSNSTFLEYNLPVFFSAPIQIVFDGSDSFWFTAADSDMIGHAIVSQLRNGTESGLSEFAPINQSSVTTISNPQQPSQKIVSSLSTPAQLALGRDGTLWLTEHTASSFDRYDIASKTLVKYWTSQTHSTDYSESLPNGISIDSAGDVWIAEHYGNKIAEFDPSTEQLVEFPIPCCAGGIAGTLYLTTGANGTVWFTEFFGNALGELKPTQASSSLQTLKLRLGSSNGYYSIPQGDVYNLTVPIQAGVSGHSSQELHFDLSGVSETGELPAGVSATFSPSSIFIGGSGKTSSTNLSLSGLGSNLRPGVYYFTIGAKSSLDNTTYSSMLKVTVLGDQGPSSSLAVMRGALTEALVLGGVASIIVVSSIALLVRGRRRGRMRMKRKR